VTRRLAQAFAKVAAPLAIGFALGYGLTKVWTEAL
jgi:hypothetical protein